MLTTGWLDGEKLSQSKAGDVAHLVNLGVICYLKQLLDTGFFHVRPCCTCLHCWCDCCGSQASAQLLCSAC